jgi:hypothetical protein
MRQLVFSPHALQEMGRNTIPVPAVYHVVGDADESVEQDDGRTLYEGTWYGQAISVVIEDDGITVVIVWDRKRESRRNRRRERR